MYRNKAKQECSSSILIQERLFRRALELMKAPPLPSEVMALAIGGYAELLLIQENRKSEGEKRKSWAESLMFSSLLWRNKVIHTYPFYFIGFMCVGVLEIRGQKNSGEAKVTKKVKKSADTFGKYFEENKRSGYTSELATWLESVLLKE